MARVEHRRAGAFLAVDASQQVDAGGGDFGHAYAFRAVDKLNDQFADFFERGIVIGYLNAPDQLVADQFTPEVHESEPEGNHPDIDAQIVDP